MKDIFGIHDYIDDGNYRYVGCGLGTAKPLPLWERVWIKVSTIVPSMIHTCKMFIKALVIRAYYKLFR